MLTTIVFGFALLVSIITIIDIIIRIIDKDNFNIGTLICIIMLVLSWSWLFYLLH